MSIQDENACAARRAREMTAGCGPTFLDVLIGWARGIVPSRAGVRSPMRGNYCLVGVVPCVHLQTRPRRRLLP